MKKNLKKCQKRLIAYRPLLRGSVAEYLIVALIYLFAATILTRFALLDIGNTVFASAGDGTNGLMWLNFSDPGINPLELNRSMANYPYGDATSGVMLSQYLLYLAPTRLLSFIFGWVAGINIMMYIGYLTLAMSGYWLIKRLTNHKVLAFFGGYAMAFVPYLLGKAIGHFSYIFTAYIPLAIGVFLSLWQRPSIKKAIVFSVLIATGFYLDGYLMLASALLAVICLVSGLLFDLIYKQRHKIKQHCKMIIIAAITCLVCVAPFFIIQRVYSAEINNTLQQNRNGNNIAQEMEYYRSNIVDFTLPSDTQVIAKNFFVNFDQRFEQKNQRSGVSENSNYLSLIIRITIIVGAAYLIYAFIAGQLGRKTAFSKLSNDKRYLIIFSTILTVVGSVILLAFMFSPTSHGIPLPGQFLIDHSIGFWRVMSRLFVVLNPLLVFCTMIYLWMFGSMALHRYQKNKNIRILLFWVVPLFLLAFYALENYAVWPNFKFSSTPAIYRDLKSDETIKSVAELPLVDPLDSRAIGYFTYQMTYDKPLVNDKEPNNGRITNTLGTERNPETINLLLDRDIEAVFISSVSECESTYYWGNLYKQEYVRKNYNIKDYENTNYVCLYKINKNDNQLVDPVYMNFENGFITLANPSDPSAIYFNGLSGSFEFVTKDLVSAYKGIVNVSFDLNYPDATNDDYWELRQGEEVVATGNFDTTKKVKVLARINTSSSTSFVIEIKNNNQQPNVTPERPTITNAVATAFDY